MRRTRTRSRQEEQLARRTPARRDMSASTPPASRTCCSRSRCSTPSSAAALSTPLRVSVSLCLQEVLHTAHHHNASASCLFAPACMALHLRYQTWVSHLLPHTPCPFCLAVQHEAIPQALMRQDILCQAKSGMGKTAVFVISILQNLEPKKGVVQALVLCHTRELSFQVGAVY